MNVKIYGYEVHMGCLTPEEAASITILGVRDEDRSEADCPRCGIPLNEDEQP